MTSLLRLSALRQRLRASLWFWPAISVTLAVVAGLTLPALESEAGISLGSQGFAGTPEGARSVLSTVAGSMITVTGLTFSLTVVALQVASTQFTPRLLGTFLSDRGNQAVLSVFLGTFAYSLAVLRSVRSAAEGAVPFVPDIAVAVGLALTLLSVAMLVYFFHHLTQQLRVESVLAEVRQDTLSLIRRYLPERDDGGPAPQLPEVPDRAWSLRARRDGYLQAVDVGALRRAADDHGVVVRLRPSIGTHVSEGTTLAWAWPAPGGDDDPADAASDDDVDELGRRVHGGIHLGPERTLQQDVAFGVRQLVDIATRALSPGTNDPTTAVATLGALAAVLNELVGRRLDPLVASDDDGRVRAAAPQPTFPEVLALACDQPRRYGRAEPAVLTQLLGMLTDLAEVAPDDGSRRAVRSQVDATVGAAEKSGLDDTDLERVRVFARHAWAALERGARIADVPARSEEPAP